MKSAIITNEYLSFLCRELSFSLRSGMNIATGVQIIEDNNEVPELNDMLHQIGTILGAGKTLSEAFTACGCFSAETIQMVAAGENTGHLEETLTTLADYYDNAYRLGQQIRRSAFMPAILMTLILAVVGILISVVLPIFKDIYASLGVELSGAAKVFFGPGTGSGVLGWAIFAILAALMVILFYAAFVAGDSSVFSRRLVKGAVGRDLADARFVSILSTAVSSGLAVETAAKMAAEVAGSFAESEGRYDECAERILLGESLQEALDSILPAKYKQALAIGIQSGFADETLRSVAAKLQANAEERLETRIMRIEPVILIIMSVLMGCVIISFLLPLLDIMSVIA